MSSYRFTNHTFRPRYQSRPYIINPGRREHIYGKVQPMPHNPTRIQYLIIIAWVVVISSLGTAMFQKLFL